MTKDAPTALVMSPNQVASMVALVDADNFVDSLAGILNLQDYKDNTRNSILLDFYSYILSFAKENHMDNEKTSLLITLLKYFHEKSMENKLGLNQSYLLFKQLILNNCSVTQDVAHKNTSFTPSEVKAITEFLTSSYFQHYQLYFHVFTQQQEVHEEHQFVFVETAVTPPPLSSALTEQDWIFHQSKEHQKRIADELGQIKTNMESMHEEHVSFVYREDPSPASDDLSEDKPAFLSAHPPHLSHLSHPSHPSMPHSFLLSSLYSPAFHSHHSPGVSQAETQKIFESVQQATSAQIIQLRDTLQKQFEDQEKQILELISRVDNELQIDNSKQNERKRTPVKHSAQTMPTVSSRPSTSVTTPKQPPLTSSSSSLSISHRDDSPP